jgi:NADPH:quinone reductase-like Zn-dependent oxidoreductase
MLRAPLLSLFVGQRLGGLNSKTNVEDLQAVTELVRAGKVKPIVGRSYSLTEAPDAIRDLATGHAGGKLVIAM